MTLAVQLLAASGVGLGLVLILILFYWVWRWISEACCSSCTRSDDCPTEVVVVPSCSCRLLKVSGFVTKFHDGDGFLFKPWCPFHRDLDQIEVRLAGIDAPEMANPGKGEPGQPFAREATDVLRNLVRNGKTLDIDKYGKDRGGRVLAMVSVPLEGSPPLNVNVEMVRLGFADLYEGKGKRYGDFEQELKKLRDEAKSAKIGFWSRIDEPDFETPSEYKRRMRKQIRQLFY